MAEDSRTRDASTSSILNRIEQDQEILRIELFLEQQGGSAGLACFCGRRAILVPFPGPRLPQEAQRGWVAGFRDFLPSYLWYEPRRVH